MRNLWSSFNPQDVWHFTLSLMNVQLIEIKLIGLQKSFYWNGRWQRGVINLQIIWRRLSDLLSGDTMSLIINNEKFSAQQDSQKWPVCDLWSERQHNWPVFSNLGIETVLTDNNTLDEVVELIASSYEHQWIEWVWKWNLFCAILGFAMTSCETCSTWSRYLLTSWFKSWYNWNSWRKQSF